MASKTGKSKRVYHSQFVGQSDTIYRPYIYKVSLNLTTSTACTVEKLATIRVRLISGLVRQPNARHILQISRLQLQLELVLDKIMQKIAGIVSNYLQGTRTTNRLQSGLNLHTRADRGLFLQLHDKLKQQQGGVPCAAGQAGGGRVNVVTVNINTNTSVNSCLHGQQAEAVGAGMGNRTRCICRRHNEPAQAAAGCQF